MGQRRFDLGGPVSEARRLEILETKEAETAKRIHSCLTALEKFVAKLKENWPQVRDDHFRQLSTKE